MLLCLVLSACYEVNKEVITRDVASAVPGLEGKFNGGYIFAFDLTRDEHIWIERENAFICSPDRRKCFSKVLDRYTVKRFRAVPLRDNIWIFQFPHPTRTGSYRIEFYRVFPRHQTIGLVVPQFKNKKEHAAHASRFGVRMMANRATDPYDDYYPRLSGKRGDILAFLLSLRSRKFVSGQGGE